MVKQTIKQIMILYQNVRLDAITRYQILLPISKCIV